MPTDFSGDPVWHGMVTGPANTDDATGGTVSDMGVLLADRTQWLREALPRVKTGHETIATTLNSEDFIAVDPGTVVSPTLASYVAAVVTARGITIVGTSALQAVILEITAPATYTLIAGGPLIEYTDVADIEVCHMVQSAGLPAGDYCAGIRAEGAADVVIDGVTSAQVIASVDPEDT